MKTLDDIKAEMSELYDSLKSRNTKREDAAELANIAGKFLKAEQLQLARVMLEHQINPEAHALPHRTRRSRQLTQAVE